MATVVNNIRLNSNALHVRDKIIALQGKKGFCWASNKELAKMIGISASYLSHQLTSLVRAGLLYRRIERDEHGEVVLRQMVAFKTAKDTALAADVVKMLEDDKTEQGTRMRLVANGKNVNISPYSVIRAIKEFGAEKVDVALSIVKASSTCKNPLKLFFAALRKGYNAGKIALGYVGQVYSDARRRVANPMRHTVSEVVEEVVVEKQTAEKYKGLSIKEGLALLKQNLRTAKRA